MISGDLRDSVSMMGTVPKREIRCAFDVLHRGHHYCASYRSVHTNEAGPQFQSQRTKLSQRPMLETDQQSHHAVRTEQDY